MCSGFMSFRAPPAATKQKNLHNSPNMQPILTFFSCICVPFSVKKTRVYIIASRFADDISKRTHCILQTSLFIRNIRMQ